MAMCAICPPRTARSGPTKTSRWSWEVDTASQKALGDIGNALKDADELILATDPDREGEAISWHVLDVLEQKKLIKDKPVSRVVFNAITKIGHHRGDEASAADRRAAGRCLSRAPGARLSRRALPSRRSSGASCRARARRAASSRWRCASSATARTRSRSSSRSNTGRSRRSSSKRARASRRGSIRSTARSPTSSTSRPATKPMR